MFGLNAGGSLAQRAAALEDEIAAAAGGAFVEPVRAPGMRAAPPRQATTALIAGVDVNRGVAITAYGEIALEPVALGIIVGVLSRAMREHLEAQLVALNTQLGVPAQASTFVSAIAGAATTGAPPMPSLNGTQGHAEGEDAVDGT